MLNSLFLPIPFPFIANNKITWGKFRFGTPKFIVKSYALIAATLMFAHI